MMKKTTLSNSQQITILTFYYMPLNYSEKDTKDFASIVQTLGNYEMKRKSNMLHTHSFCMPEISGDGLPRRVRYGSQRVQPLNCCSRNLFTYSRSTVSITHGLLTHLFKNAQSANKSPGACTVE